MTSFTQRSFAGGVLSPALYSRSDTSKYQTGFADSQNMVVQRFGSLTSRTGTKHVALTYVDTEAPVLFPFNLSDADDYLLEFGHLYMRVIYDNGFGFGADPHDVITTPFTLANVRLMQVKQYGAVLYIVSPGFAPYVLTRVSEGVWTLAAVRFTPTIDRPYDLRDTNAPSVGTLTSTGSTPGNGETITIDAKVYTLKTVLTNTEGEVLIGSNAAASLDNLKLAINHGEGFGTKYYCVAAHPTVAAIDNTNTTQIVRARLVGTAGNAIVTTETSSQLSWGGATLAGGVSDGTDTFRWVVTAFDAGLQESATSDYVVNSVTSNTLTWDRVPNAIGYFIYKTQNNGQYGFIGTITDPGIGTTVTFVDASYPPDYKDPPPIYFNPFETENPSVIGIYQQRLIFGSTPSKPDGIWMSQVGFPTNFATRTPLTSGDAVIFQLASGDVVRHVVPIGGKLTLLTSGGEWQIRGGSDGVVTPTAINATQHSYNGCSSALPFVMGDTAVYVQEKGSVVQDMRFNYESDGFTGSDLTVFSQHLVDTHTLVSVGYAQTPNRVLWCVREDGVLLGLTYLREHQIAGWHEHSSRLVFKSVCVISEGGEHVPYFVVYTPTSKYAIVRMSFNTFTSTIKNAFLDMYYSYDGRIGVKYPVYTGTMTLESDGPSDYTTVLQLTASNAHFVGSDHIGNKVVFDDGIDVVYLTIESKDTNHVVQVRPDRAVPSKYLDTPLSANWSIARKTIPGITALANQTVSVCADGYALPDATISGAGLLTLPDPYSVIFIGYKYTADVTLLDLDQTQNETMYDRQIRVRDVTIRVQDTSSFKAGPDEDNLQSYKSAIHSYDGGTGPTKGNANIVLTGGWDETTSVLIRQEDPLPLTVQAVVRRCLISET